MNELDLELAAYEYVLPPELIAQEPAPERDASKLLVLDRATGKRENRLFRDIVNYFKPGDCLVINHTSVVPARLFGNKETGGRVEALFLNPAAGPDAQGRVAALLRPYLPPGKTVIFPDGLRAVVEGKTEKGEALLKLSGPALDGVLAAHGFMPLPPYINRKDEVKVKYSELDRQRYQTVYAAHKGSIAAPTAGLHFTDALLDTLRAAGVTVAPVTLHVGWGTFKPVTAAKVSEHVMLPEHYEISASTADAINVARAAKKRVIAVGTTSVRTLESAARLSAFAQNGKLDACAGDTSIFIHPGHAFKLVDAMVTNFHLPHSTPLLMVSALAGRETILAAYAEAIQNRYRFYSYGDAMMIL